LESILAGKPGLKKFAKLKPGSWVDTAQQTEESGESGESGVSHIDLMKKRDEAGTSLLIVLRH
jgi:hypothetical protein